LGPDLGVRVAPAPAAAPTEANSAQVDRSQEIDVGFPGRPAEAFAAAAGPDIPGKTRFKPIYTIDLRRIGFGRRGGPGGGPVGASREVAGPPEAGDPDPNGDTTYEARNADGFGND
jgi:hypothetical protein